MRRHHRIALLSALIGATGVALLVIGTGEVDRAEPPRRKAATGPSGPTAAAPTPPPRRAEPAVPAAVRAQAAALPLARQVAQLFLVGFEGTDATSPFFAELRERGWGGVLMTADNVLSPDQGALLAGEAAVASDVPPLVAAPGAAGFELPEQSPADSPSAVRAQASDAASRLRAAGVNLVLAPRADVGTQTSEGTFGDEPEAVAARVVAAVRGWRAGGVVPAPGRFPGEAGVSQDPLEGPATVGLSRAELRARDLVPYRQAARRAPAIVLSSSAFSAYDPVTPAALTPEIVQGLLRDELGFTGVAITDDLAGVTAATGGTLGEAAVEAIRAGADMVQISDPEGRDAAYGAVLAAVRARRIRPQRLREAVLRVLSLKRAAGLGSA